MKKRYWIIVLICELGIVLVLSFYISNPWNARRIGDIPAPKGYTRISADVARNNSGKIAILCIEGNTPAREAHVVRNMNPFKTAWHTIGEDDCIKISVFRFRKEELRRL